MAHKIKNVFIFTFFITYSSIKYVVNWTWGFIEGIFDRIFFPEFVDENNRENKED